MGEGRALIASCLQGFLKPGHRFVEFTFLDQIGPDIIIGVAEVRVLRDRLVTFLNRLVDFTLCGLAGDLFEKPQEMGFAIRFSASS